MRLVNAAMEGRFQGMWQIYWELSWRQCDRNLALAVNAVYLSVPLLSAQRHGRPNNEPFLSQPLNWLSQALAQLPRCSARGFSPKCFRSQRILETAPNRCCLLVLAKMLDVAKPTPPPLCVTRVDLVLLRFHLPLQEALHHHIVVLLQSLWSQLKSGVHVVLIDGIEVAMVE
jgi:hypothetical protein